MRMKRRETQRSGPRDVRELAGSSGSTGTAPVSQREAVHAKPNNLPDVSLRTLFKGRDAFLEDLRRRLGGGDGRAAAIVARQAVHGLGGVGKTRAAIEYAWRCQDDYTAFLFVSAPSAAELRTKLADLVGVLAIATAETAVEPRLVAVLSWLDAHPGWLLILDNVDTEEAAREVYQLLSRLRAGHVLITSRIANWRAGVEPLELHVLAQADAVAFLLERTPHRPRKPDDDALRGRDRTRAGWPGPGPGAGGGLHRQAAAELRRVPPALGGEADRGAEVARRAGDGVSGQRGRDLGDDLRPVGGAGAAVARSAVLAGPGADPTVPVRDRAADGGGARAAGQAGGPGGLLAGAVRSRGGRRPDSPAGPGDHPRPHSRGRPHRDAANRPGRRERRRSIRSRGRPHLGGLDAACGACGGGLADTPTPPGWPSRQPG